MEGSEALKMYVLPFPSPGHTIPLINLAQILALKGHHITILTTPSNAQVLPNNLNVHTFDFPSDQVGLPSGLENAASAGDSVTAHKILKAALLLKPQIETLVQQNPPHAIYSHPQVLPSVVPFVVPAVLPHTITFDFNPSSAPGFDALAQLFLHTKHNNTHGIIVNSFEELEDGYTQCYQKLTGVKVWHVGMTSLMLNFTKKRACTSQKDQICFGTLCRHNKEQQLEIAHGVEASGHEFLWVFPKNMHVEVEEWLPHGFEERTKENNRGMVVRGWVHQELILKHVAIGGFLTQCGWNSVTEGISAGVPLITMPRFAEQFLNEKLVTEVHKIGVEVGECEWSISSYDAGSKVVGWELIKNAVERVMKDEGGSLRKRAKDMQEKAHKAIQKGGSSYNNLTALVQSLKQKNIHG
ncbi:UDP-glucose flavonoid 3-O-glucosyltransferase 7 [Glycine soja]|uniref:Glycosyltransferase n=3 Tax=Glycine subgen. Soja TaxID=1462606 RepID=A0A445JP66_GLYSO|nr:UDP-glucose flavonoid 3-O-glucosyltransferase 7 [Glycine soja]